MYICVISIESWFCIFFSYHPVCITINHHISAFHLLATYFQGFFAMLGIAGWPNVKSLYARYVNEGSCHLARALRHDKLQTWVGHDGWVIQDPCAGSLLVVHMLQDMNGLIWHMERLGRWRRINNMVHSACCTRFLQVNTGLYLYVFFIDLFIYCYSNTLVHAHVTHRFWCILSVLLNYMCRNEGKSISSIKTLGNIHTSKAVDLRILVLLPFTYLDSKKSSCVVSMDLFKTPPPPFHFKNLTLKVAVSHSSLIGKRFPLDSSRESSRGHGAVRRWRAVWSLVWSRRWIRVPAVRIHQKTCRDGWWNDSKIFLEFFTPIYWGEMISNLFKFDELFKFKWVGWLVQPPPKNVIEEFKCFGLLVVSLDGKWIVTFLL